MCCYVIETSSDLPRMSSESSENFEKRSETFAWPSDNFWRLFGNIRKVFGNLQKIVKKSSLVCLYNKQNITYPLVDTNFIFSCSTQYRVEHSKKKFVSTRGHVIPLYINVSGAPNKLGGNPPDIRVTGGQKLSTNIIYIVSRTSMRLF